MARHEKVVVYGKCACFRQPAKLELGLLVEVGESKPLLGICVDAGQGTFYLLRAPFWGVPVVARRVPWKPGTCVKRASPCQGYVNKCT